MKLYGSRTSPYARKVRVVLAEKKIDYQMIEEDVWSPHTTIGQFNPLGKVPCLIMEDGGAVFDSRVIVEYADTLSPVSRLIPQGSRERLEVRCWEALADGLLDAALLVRVESTQRTEAQRSETWVARQRGKIDAALVAMASGLGDRPWCTGIHYSLADVAVGCALAYLDFRFPEIPWRERHPTLAAFQEKIEKRQSFLDTQPPSA
ncbi:glutathione S-transferase N-terminal domain-containing protein [Cupriavidus plantarum]|uniref:Glutathione S-transferase n=1 Tax=Cupriavidus plantarum TaxID=942865 RepID=A0A316FF67_9BURK|nr:glutathione S-transferase N-terminal domain-containing protein [Cupriavidus plantarum]NYH99066.1 glutathione S-transferase [Cupriavidus plantarum]PWK36290.1 glutathione S-transferase [Cupriavidus plantarum]REF02957.1 glutathione S-transferase [Cupriavidus plantarum]RLK44178.1 glutathione S-transferase [Cupriavidus plantarum]CAG2141877.1 putative GST-like protein YibF [Cupriavidus plantarum]